MKNKILIFIAISFLPLLAMADVRGDIKRQLDETINSRSFLITTLQDISSRVADREQILVTDGALSDALKAEIDLNLNEADNALANASDENTNTLPDLANQLLASDKSSRAASLKEFRSEADKIKAEIVLARKLIIESINLIKEVE